MYFLFIRSRKTSNIETSEFYWSEFCSKIKHKHKPTTSYGLATIFDG